jgi:hypothetical protein
MSLPVGNCSSWAVMASARIATVRAEAAEDVADSFALPLPPGNLPFWRSASFAERLREGAQDELEGVGNA